MRFRCVALLALLALAMAAGGALATASGPNGAFEGYPVVNVVVNGQPISSDVPAINFNGRTMVPVRFVSEALGAAVQWDGETWTAAVTMPNVQQLQSDLATAQARITELEQQLAGQTGSPSTEPAELASKVKRDLGTYIANVTVGGKALSFVVSDVTPNYTLFDDTYTRIFVNIDPSKWVNHLDLLIAGKEPLIQSWLQDVGALTSTLCNGGPFRITFFYQQSYSSYPSSYDPDEITLDTTTYKWRVTHIFARVDNLNGVIRVDTDR